MGTRHKNVRIRMCRLCHPTFLPALLTFSSLALQTQAGLIILDEPIEPLRPILPYRPTETIGPTATVARTRASASLNCGA